MAEPIIMTGIPIPPIIRRGRPIGKGANIDLLKKIKPGDLHSCIWGLSKKKMNSIRTTAHQQGILITIRALENDKYAIWRNKDET